MLSVCIARADGGPASAPSGPADHKRRTMATTTTAAPHDTQGFQAQAERWVADFTEGWRAPTGPQAFADHFRSRLSSDVRLIQPQLPTVVGHRGFEERFVR